MKFNMKILLSLFLVVLPLKIFGQAWKVLPKGVRILGYRNVTTSKITKNFNQSGQESSLGSSFRIDASTFNEMSGNLISGNLDPKAYNALTIGAYRVDADAQFNVQGMGFGYGITDKIMFYGELAYYNATIKSKITRTSGNTYEEVARLLEKAGGTGNNLLAENLRQMIDANEGTIQSTITNYYGYKPLGDWYGKGYGDMETGFMMNLVDKGVYGLTFYPGVILPTGREDDPDILQDVGFGDGQYDLFSELTSGYVFNDHLSFGSTVRYTYQAPTSKELRVPSSRDFQLSADKDNFEVKYGDKINISLFSTISLNDWVSFTPTYRFMNQGEAEYQSSNKDANRFLAYNSDRREHLAMLTTTFSSITPFLKKEFPLPAQVNINLVRTINGKNVPDVSRFEAEFRMLF
jgi:hypothetical protein